MIRDIIDVGTYLGFYIFLTMGSYSAYKFIRYEALSKVKQGHPSLHTFTQKLTGQKFEYLHRKPAK